MTLPSGIYFCDIYSSSATTTIPTNALLSFDSAAKVGYSDVATLTRGVVFNSNSSGDVGFVTYSIVPRFNTIGQQVPFNVLPFDLSGNSFTYRYIIL
jgi:hypothetical protein